MRSYFIRLLCGFCTGLCISLAFAQSPTQRLRGEVVWLEGKTLQIRSAQTGSTSVILADNVRLIAVSDADRSAIVAGVFLGTTAIPQADGSLKAVEVHIFPESMRGAGEGHRPMDSLPGRTMTNATVTGVAPTTSGPTMTNATVTKVSPDQYLTLQYEGGEKRVSLGADVPIVLLETAERSLLIPGAHVVLTVTPQTDGSLRAERITIGKNGTVPPM